MSLTRQGWLLVAMPLLLVAGVGAATSYFGAARETAVPSHAETQDDALARLADYTRSIKTE